MAIGPLIPHVVRDSTSGPCLGSLWGHPRVSGTLRLVSHKFMLGLPWIFLRNPSPFTAGVFRAVRRRFMTDSSPEISSLLP